jgi:plasmid stability protein
MRWLAAGLRAEFTYSEIAASPVIASAAGNRWKTSRVSLEGLPAMPTMLSKERAMPTLTIRNVDAELQQRLRVRAAQNGRSMEAELRHILKDVLRADPVEEEVNLAEAIRRLFAPFGGVELELPPRELIGQPIEFDK